MRIRLFGAMMMAALLTGCGTSGTSTTQPTSAASTTIAQQTSIPATTMPTAMPTTAPPTSAPPVEATALPPTLAPTDSPTVAPTVAPTVVVPPATSAPAGRTITISQPAAGATIQSPLHIEGAASVSPFEMNLVLAVYDAEGNQLGLAPVTAQGELGGPVTFAADLAFAAPPTARVGNVTVTEYSAKDGSIVVQGATRVQLTARNGDDPYLALPADQAPVTLPVHVEAVDLPEGQYTLRLRFDDGTVLEQPTTTFATGDGRGAIIDNLAWATESAPPDPGTQRATLEIADTSANVVLTQSVYFIHRDDPQAMPIKAYWYAGEEMIEVTRYVPRTQAVAAAAMRELLWGPAGNELAAAGFTTGLPTPDQVATFAGRQPTWGARIYLNGISINAGIATVDLSDEARAFGGGSARVQQITEQIRATLTQFPTISDVRILINGQEDVLQP